MNYGSFILVILFFLSMLIDSGFFKGYSLTGVERTAKPNSDGMSWLIDFSLELMIIH